MTIVRQFLETLLPNLGGGFIEIRAIHPHHGPQSRFYPSLDALFAEQEGIDTLAKHSHVYFGVCPRNRREGTKDAVRLASCLWADVDAKLFPGGKAEALKRLREFPLPPTVIVDSGHGYHAYWRFKEPEQITGPEDVARVEANLKALAQALKADPSAAELARILRLPGTQNLKDLSAPLPVIIVECDPGRQFNLSDFQFLLDIPASTPSVPKNPTGWISDLLSGLTEGNRNTTFARVAGRLRRDGWEAEDIVALLTLHAQASGFPLEELYQEVKKLCQRYSRFSTTSPTIKGDGDVEFVPVALSEAEEPGERVDLVAGLIPEGYPSVLYGDGGQGKSQMSLGLATCIATGKPFLGLEAKQSGVLYLDWELEQDEMIRRAYKIARGLGLTRPPENLWYVRVGHSLSEILELVRHFVEEHEVGLVIVDSLGPAGRGDPELAKVVIPLLAGLRCLNTTELVIDHQSKLQQGQEYARKTPFGSVYKYNLARSVLQVQRVDGRDGQLDLILRQTKSNFGSMCEPIPIRLTFEEKQVRMIRVDPKEEPAFTGHLRAEDRLLMSLREDGPSSAKELAARTDLKKGTVTNTVIRLKREGLVRVKVKQGHAPLYEATSPQLHNISSKPCGEVGKEKV